MTDQTLKFGPAVGFQPGGDSPWSFGASVFGVYRSMQLSMSMYREEDGHQNQSYDFKDFGLMASLGAQYDFGGGWRAGATVQSPNLHVYGTGRRVVSVSTPGEESLWGAYTDDLDTDNRQSLQLALAIGRSVPGQYAFGFDVTYHPSASYDLMDWDFDIYGHDAARVEMKDVVDFSLGGEYYVAEGWPVRAGVFTAFSAADVPEEEYSDELVDTDLDLYGITLSVGRETETMGINLGIEYAFGHGHTIGFARSRNDSIVQAETPCDKNLILVSLGTSYYF